MANTSDEMIKKLSEAFKLVEERSKSTDAQWHKIANSVDDITHQFQSGFLSVFSRSTGFHATLKDIGGTISSSFRGSKEHLSQMQAKLDDLVDKAASLRGVSGRAPSPEYEQAIKQANAYRTLLSSHVSLSNQVATITASKWTPALLTTVVALESSVKFSHMLNQELIKASADTATRSKLMREIAEVQAATGADLQHTGKAAAALVNYGVSLRSNFKETLGIVVKMEEGLGASFETSAQMVVAVQRVGGSVQKVADGIARVKADTALAADEAVKFATQISKAVMMLKPGSGSLVDQTQEYINRLAGALKELTGSGQDIVNMLTGFTTEAGMLGAATLGATPDFLSNPAQAKEVTDRFVKYVDAQLNGTQGFQRMATIQLLAEQFNTTADMVTNAHKMQEKYNDTLRTGTGLQDEWRNQTSEIVKVFDRMGRSFGALIHQSLLPFIQVTKPLFSGLASAMQWISSSTKAATVVGWLFVGGLVALTYQMGRLTAKMIQAAVAARAYQLELPGLGGGKGPGGIMRLLGRWLPGISTAITRLAGFLTGGVVGAGLAALGVGVAAGMAINKFLGKDFGPQIAAAMTSKKDLYRSQGLILSSGRHTRAELLEHVAAMVSSGQGAKAIQDYVMSNIASVKGMHAFDGPGATPEHRLKAVMGIIEEAGAIINRQGVRVSQMGLTAQSQEDINTRNRFISIFEQIAKNTEFTAQLIKTTEHNHERRENLNRQQKDEVDTEERLKRQNQERALESINRTTWGGF